VTTFPSFALVPACRNPEVVGLLHFAQAAYLVASARRARVARSREHDGDGGAGVPGELLRRKPSLRAGEQEGQQIAAQPGRMACASGSPNRQLNSNTRGPRAVSIRPA